MSYDRRKQLTQRMLKEALVELMDEKPLARITVTELCERADVNRSTYYKYYMDPRQQAETMCDEFLTVLLGIMTKHGRVEFSQEESLAVTKELVACIYENRQIFRVLANCFGYESYVRHMTELFRQFTLESWKSNGYAESAVHEELALAYVMGGATTALLKWVSDEQPRLSADEVAELITRNNACFMAQAQRHRETS